jgi:small subunit ribosomal protein S1
MSNDNDLEFELDNADFAAMLDNSLKTGRKATVTCKPGESIEGVVTKITDKTVFVDIQSRDDAVIDIMEFKDDAGELTIKVGDSITAYCVSLDDGILLTSRLSGKMIDAGLADAQASGLPVEGKVISERKGGFEVQVGSTSAFCPYSQIDAMKQDAANYIGNTYSFLIQEYSENGRNVVVNRRKLVEKEREAAEKALRESLKEGDIVDGKVTRLAPFGVFVDIGGVEGLVHVSEMAWGRVEKPDGLVTSGQEVQVKIKEINWQNGRISLSLRGMLPDPWYEAVGRYTPNTVVQGKITRLAQFGAFVELEPGVEGLVHISKLGAGRRIGHPSDVVKEGDTVEVRIESVDVEARRISLSMDKKGGGKLEASDTSEASTPVDPQRLRGLKGEGSFGSANDIFGKLKF